MSFLRKLLSPLNSFQRKGSEPDSPKSHHRTPTVEGPDDQFKVAPRIDVYVVLWNATNVGKQSKNFRINTEISLRRFIPSVFRALEIPKLGLQYDQVELWAYESPLGEKPSISGLHYDKHEKRLTKLPASEEQGLVSDYVDLRRKGLYFIARPTLVDRYGNISRPNLSRVVRTEPGMLPRLETLEKIWEILQERHVVHARGIPACGKSTLARSFEKYIRWTSPHLPVLLMSWTNALNTPITYINSLIEHNPDFFGDLQDTVAITSREYVLIIDEAQESYIKQDFWTDFVKTISDTPFPGKPFIFLLSSWGSPADAPLTVVNSTPATLEPAKRMSIQPSASFSVGLYFTEDNFKDYLYNSFLDFENANNGKLIPCFTKKAQDFLYYYTSGHPGMCYALVSMIKNHDSMRASMKVGEAINLRDIHKMIESSGFIENLRRCTSGVRRCIPTADEMRQPAMAKTMLIALRDGCIRDVERDPLDPPQTKDTDIMKVYKKGYLQADLDLMTSVFMLYPHDSTSWLLQKPFPIDHIPSPLKLCLMAIDQFSPEALKRGGRGIGVASLAKTGGGAKPYEAQYQDELYRGCHIVLNEGRLTSEWMSEAWPGDRIDFIVKEMKWGIELIRDGNAATEHCARFKKGGQYWDSIVNGEIREFVVLDFTKRKPAQPWSDTFLYRVVFDENFHRVQVYDNNLQLIHTNVLLKGQ